MLIFIIIIIFPLLINSANTDNHNDEVAKRRHLSVALINVSALVHHKRTHERTPMAVCVPNVGAAADA